MEPDRPEEPDRLTGWPAPPSPTGRRRRVVLAVGAGAVTALLVAGAIVRAQNDGSTQEGGGAENHVSPSSSAPPSVNWPSPRSTPRPLPPEVINSRGFLAELDVVLYARGDDSIFRLDTRAGRVTRTRGLDLQSGAPAALLAGPDRALVRPVERDQPGFVVIDGQPTRPLTGALAADGSAAQPGPRGRIWITTFPENGTATATLTDFTGRRVSSTLRVRGSGWFSSDGAGGLLYSGVGGTYRATPGGLRRLTSGAVIATGPRHYLTIECDARHVCGSYLYGRESSEKRRVASVYTNDVGNGQLSRDGRYAAWVRWGDSGSTLRVTDLRTNRTLSSFPLGGDSATEEGLMVWLPDGRLLGVSEGRLFVFDPRRSRTVRPNLRLPPLLQVALRAG